MKRKVKMCGLRTRQDVAACAGADAMGVVVLSKSRRNLSLPVAKKVLDAVPPGVLRVAVTRCSSPARLQRIASVLAPDAIQVHRELPVKLWEEIRGKLDAGTALYGLLGIRPGAGVESLRAQAQALRKAPMSGVFLDTILPTASGGTGTPHDWQLSARVREFLRPVPVILAGGLTPENVAQAVRIVSPDWVDTASGVENGGCKSPQRVQEFLREARDEAE